MRSENAAHRIAVAWSGLLMRDVPVTWRALAHVTGFGSGFALMRQWN
jgi:hypothetical protein